MSRRSMYRWLAGLLILALIAFGVARALSARKAQSEQLAASMAAKAVSKVELATTDVVKASLLEVLQGLPISGSLKAVNSAVVKARVAGDLRGLTVREGDFVTAGQVLASIDASEYQARVRQAQNQADSARAQVEIAKRQYDNNKALVDQGFISKTSLDTSLASLNAAQATYKAAVAATEVSAKSVQDTVVRAPIAGQVSQRLAQSGERVGVDSRIVEIVDVSRLELEATLAAAQSIDVQVGQTAELRIEGSDKVVTGKVVRINPSAQTGSRSVLAYLSINNLDSSQPASAASAGNALPLRQGLFAQGTLGTTRTRLLAVPVSSVRTDKPAPYLQLIENGQLMHRPVELGVRGTSGGEPVVAVTGAGGVIAEGALVVRGHIGSLREGTAVRFTGMTADAAQAQANPMPRAAP